MKARDGELTAVSGAERFDEPPALVTSERDRRRWAEFREAYHRAQRHDAPVAFPLQVDFELNSTCQMRCAHCTHGQGAVQKRLLPFEDFARVVEEGERHGLVSVKLNYINEPLLRPDLASFVRYARERGVLNVYFATNGLLLSRDRARELIDAGVSKVLVSLDATTPRTFSLVRRSTRLPEIEENVRGLLDLRRELGVRYPVVRVNFLRAPENVTEESEFVARWTGVADAIGFQTQVRMPGVDDDFLGVTERVGPFRCSFPSKLLVVDSAGDILPCCTFSGREMSVGNVSSMTLAEAWAGRRARDLRDLHAAGEGMQNPVCARCVGSCSSS